MPDGLQIQMPRLPAIIDRCQDVECQPGHTQDFGHPAAIQFEAPSDIRCILEFAFIEQALPVERAPDGSDRGSPGVRGRSAKGDDDNLRFDETLVSLHGQ